MLLPLPSQVIVVVIGLWSSCQLCCGEPVGHVSVKTTAPQPITPTATSGSSAQEATVGDALPTAETVRRPFNSFGDTPFRTLGRRLIKFFFAHPQQTREASSAMPRADNLDRKEAPSLPDLNRNSPGPYDRDNFARAYGPMSMFPIVAGTATTPGQQLYVTLPESQPLIVPYTTQHRFGPVLR